MSDVVEVGVGNCGTQIGQKFGEQDGAVCLGDQTSEVQISVWMFATTVLQVDEIRDPFARKATIRWSFRQSL